MKPYEPQSTDRFDLAGRGIDESKTFASIMQQTLARRALLKGAAMAAPAAAVPGLLAATARPAEAAPAPLTFVPVPENKNDTVTVPPGYTAQVVIQWGDPLFPNMVPFDVHNQSPAEQARRFGFNNDMIALFSLPYGAPARLGGRLPHPSYLMAVNHEYSVGAYQFPDYPIVGSRDTTVPAALPTLNQVQTVWESLGISVVEIDLVNGAWVPNVNSAYNRRVTVTTPIDITGPARGDELMRTPADPAGTVVKGTFANCAGGQTPWGTYLSGEENFDGMFNNLNGVTDPTLKALHAQFPFFNKAATVANANDNTLFWEAYDSRFNLATPEGAKEPFRFGWVVEVDPYDPAARPKKRTALGRFKHEGAQTVLNPTDRLVVYSGDDEVFEYVYKYVSNGRYNPADRAANSVLLDEGMLFVARFNNDGTGQWLPLDFATVNALALGKFRNQADVLIRAREAADVLGATPMDRPEDIEAPRNESWHGDGRVYLVCTNNSGRNAGNLNGANIRPNNVAGHIIEMYETNGDAAALTFAWRFFLLAGDPAAAPDSNLSVQWFGIQTFQGDRFGSPDNIAFDNTGNIFIATDGTAKATPNCNDMVVVASTAGNYPREVKRFLTGPKEAEICGPLLTPDNTTFFCAIQHPGENGTLVDRSAKLKRTSSWPNGGNNAPRPSVVAVRRTDGGRIGS